MTLQKRIYLGRLLFLVVLGLGVSTLALAQEEPILMDSGEKDTKTLAPILKELPSGKKTPIPESDEYKWDAEYQKLRRYDFLPYWLTREKELRLSGSEDTTPTIRTQDKAMVLAGEGFQIPDLQRFVPKTGIETNPYTYIDIAEPKLPVRERGDQLAPGLEKTVSRKELIFHPQVSAFHNVASREVPVDPRPEPSYTAQLRKIRDTRVLLSTGDETELSLSPAKKHLDLLHEEDRRNLQTYLRDKKRQKVKARKGR